MHLLGFRYIEFSLKYVWLLRVMKERACLWVRLHFGHPWMHPFVETARRFCDFTPAMVRYIGSLQYHNSYELRGAGGEPRPG